MKVISFWYSKHQFDMMRMLISFHQDDDGHCLYIEFPIWKKNIIFSNGKILSHSLSLFFFTCKILNNNTAVHYIKMFRLMMIYKHNCCLNQQVVCCCSTMCVNAVNSNQPDIQTFIQSSNYRFQFDSLIWCWWRHYIWIYSSMMMMTIRCDDDEKETE